MGYTIKIVFPPPPQNIVEKGENAGYQHFLLFPQCFSEAFILRFVKACIVL